MEKNEAIKLIDERMCFGRGKWSQHHMPEIDGYWKAGQMAIKALEQAPAIPIDWIEAQIPDSTEFYAVVTAIILRHLIDEYRKEKHNDKTE